MDVLVDVLSKVQFGGDFLIRLSWCELDLWHFADCPFVVWYVVAFTPAYAWRLVSKQSKQLSALPEWGMGEQGESTHNGECRLEEEASAWGVEAGVWWESCKAKCPSNRESCWFLRHWNARAGIYIDANASSGSNIGLLVYFNSVKVALDFSDSWFSIQV